MDLVSRGFQIAAVLRTLSMDKVLSRVILAAAWIPRASQASCAVLVMVPALPIMTG